MIPEAWSAPLGSYLWQVALHATIMGAILYIWVNRLGLSSGRTRRQLLALILFLPLVTAAVPGRSGVEFAERVAWLNSARLLGVPLVFGFRLYHLVLLAAALTTVTTLWQELLAFLNRPRSTGGPVPKTVTEAARRLPGWEQCEVGSNDDAAIDVSTGGRPARPRLVISRGALEGLSPDELAIAIAHEHAHWRHGRWWWTHVLFGIRLLQCYHPVALWAFREYCVEVESDCDEDAVAGRDPRALARVLLRIYESTDRRDAAARAVLRTRIEALIGRRPRGSSLPAATLVSVVGLLLLVLPWIV